MEDFTSTEAFVMMGELYAEKRRLKSRLEIQVEQTEECKVANELLREEIEDLTTQLEQLKHAISPDGENTPDPEAAP